MYNKKNKWSLVLIVAVGLVGCQMNSNQSSNTSTSLMSSSSMQTESSASSMESSSTSSSISATSESQLTEGTEMAADLSLGYLVIVNKKHPLASDYNPGENGRAGEQIRKLIRTMQEQGFAISSQYSGFRSFAYQQELYQGYVAQSGKIEADKTSARPGYSEHQTGLAFDILNSSGQLLGEYGDADDDAVTWLHAHAHEYGFVLRYLAGKESITGYSYEPWHLRFVGDADLAKQIYESGLTLEEYFGITGGDYAQ